MCFNLGIEMNYKCLTAALAFIQFDAVLEEAVYCNVINVTINIRKLELKFR